MEAHTIEPDIAHVTSLSDTPAAKDYRGCGRAWVAFDANGVPLAIRYMADHDATAMEGHDVPDRRFKGGVRRVYRPKYTGAEQRAIFESHRNKCRAELAELGYVCGGMVSCWEFIASPVGVLRMIAKAVQA